MPLYELSRIAEAYIYKDPFSYIEIENFLDPFWHETIAKNFPDEEQMVISAENSRQLDIVSDPGVKRTLDGSWGYKSRLDRDKIEFWDVFVDYFMGNDFKTSLLTKFEITHDNNYSCARLNIDKKGSGLGPHIGRFDKIISLILCLDNNNKAGNINLLRPKNKNFVADNRHHGHEDFEIIMEIPYRQNKMIAWETTRDSFYSFHQEEETNRRTLNFFIQREMDPRNIWKVIKETKQYANDWKKDIE